MTKTDPSCIFCKIVAGQIPSKKAYEDEEIFAFHDIHPWAPVHLLIIPRQHIVSLQDCGRDDAPLLGRILALAPELAAKNGARPGPEGGFRVMINSGQDGGQEVPHLHIHVIGGPRPWTKG